MNELELEIAFLRESLSQKIVEIEKLNDKLIKSGDDST